MDLQRESLGQTEVPPRTPWFFRQRKFLPLPFIMAGLVDILRRGHPFHRGTLLRIWLDCIAWGLILGGESIRIWAVGYIGRKSRSSDIHASRLITGGPYAHTRNPLYFGGCALTMGLSLLTGSSWIILGCLAYWVIVYGPIIQAEEQFLHRAFGRTYAAYRRMVPRWWPQLWPGPGARRARWHWPELAKEYQTISAIVAVALLIQLSLLGSDWLHGRWKPHRPATPLTTSPPVTGESTPAAQVAVITSPVGRHNTLLDQDMKVTVLAMADERKPQSAEPPRWQQRGLSLASGLATLATTLSVQKVEDLHDEDRVTAIAASALVASAIGFVVGDILHHFTQDTFHRSVLAFAPHPPAALEWEPYLDPDEEGVGLIVRFRF